MAVSTVQVLRTATRLKCLDRAHKELGKDKPDRAILAEWAKGYTEVAPDVARALTAWATRAPNTKEMVKVLFFKFGDLTQTRLKESRKPRYVQ